MTDEPSNDGHTPPTGRVPSDAEIASLLEAISGDLDLADRPDVPAPASAEGDDETRSASADEVSSEIGTWLHHINRSILVPVVPSTESYELLLPGTEKKKIGVGPCGNDIKVFDAPSNLEPLALLLGHFPIASRSVATTTISRRMLFPGQPSRVPSMAAESARPLSVDTSAEYFASDDGAIRFRIGRVEGDSIVLEVHARETDRATTKPVRAELWRHREFEFDTVSKLDQIQVADLPIRLDGYRRGHVRFSGSAFHSPGSEAPATWSIRVYSSDSDELLARTIAELDGPALDELLSNSDFVACPVRPGSADHWAFACPDPDQREAFLDDRRMILLRAIPITTMEGG